MSLKSGFYNSMNGDRKYSATDMSSLFDGLINDGVFMSVGSNFAVTADSGNTVIVGTGRAWFNHTWTYNDSAMNVYLDDSDMVQDRIDAIVLEVNSTDNVRNNTIKVINGTASSSPVNPTLVNEEMIHQYPLAYINRPANSKEISQIDITNAVGTSECPFVTGIIDVNNIDVLVAQWQAKFDTWFDGVKGKLDGDAAGKLSNEILEVNEKIDGHNIKSIVGEEGVHNLRIINNKIQNKNNEEWENIDIGAKVLKDDVSMGLLETIEYTTNNGISINRFNGGLYSNVGSYNIYNYNVRCVSVLNGNVYAFLYYSSGSYKSICVNITQEKIASKNVPITPSDAFTLGEYIYIIDGTSFYKFNGTTFTQLDALPSSDISNNKTMTYGDNAYCLAYNSNSNSCQFYKFNGTYWTTLTAPSSSGSYRAPVVCKDGIHYFTYAYSSSYNVDHIRYNGSWTSLTSVPTDTSSSSNYYNRLACGSICIDNIVYVTMENSSYPYRINAWDINNNKWLNSNSYSYDDISYTTTDYNNKFYSHYDYFNNKKAYINEDVYMIYDNNSSLNTGTTRCKKISKGNPITVLKRTKNGNSYIQNQLSWNSLSGNNLTILPNCNEIAICVSSESINIFYSTIIPYTFLNSFFLKKSVNANYFILGFFNNYTIQMYRSGIKIYNSGTDKTSECTIRIYYR